jgi:hypothetical protein
MHDFSNLVKYNLEWNVFFYVNLMLSWNWMGLWNLGCEVSSGTTQGQVCPPKKTTILINIFIQLKCSKNEKQTILKIKKLPGFH